MIVVEPLIDNILKVQIAGTLTEADFMNLGSQIDPLFKKYASVKLLADASAFNGWSDMHTVAKHFSFVRDHEKKVERVALIAGHLWQHWIAGMASVFFHPEIKIFEKGQTAQAEQWLLKKHAA